VTDVILFTPCESKLFGFKTEKRKQNVPFRVSSMGGETTCGRADISLFFKEVWSTRKSGCPTIFPNI